MLEYFASDKATNLAGGLNGDLLQQRQPPILQDVRYLELISLGYSETEFGPQPGRLAYHPPLFADTHHGLQFLV